MKKLNISFSFRTYEERGLLAHHKFLTNGYVKVIHIYVYVILFCLIIFKIIYYCIKFNFLIYG